LPQASPIMNNQDTSVLLASFDNELSNEMEVDNQTFNSVSLLKTSVSDTKAHHKSKRSRKKCSRVGSSYQVVEFPMPGIYLVESKKLEIDQLWDPCKAMKEDKLDFLQTYCPYNQRELAMELFHQKGYKINGFLEFLKKQPRVDGSDWTEDVKEVFSRLMVEYRHDVQKVSKQMNCSFTACLIHYYRTVKVRQTRDSRKRNKVEANKCVDSDKVPSTWDVYFSELQSYKKEEGHCLVPKQYPTNPNLSRWVYANRREYRAIKANKIHNSTFLTEAREEKLKTIGFTFFAKYTKLQTEVESARRKPVADATWKLRFQELCDFKRETGHCLVPKLFDKNQFLSYWVFKQRAQMKLWNCDKSSCLNDQRIAMLNEIDFIWDAKKSKQWQNLEHLRKKTQVDAAWDSYYEQLVQFREEYGHSKVPKCHPPNQKLSTWAFRQRTEYRRKQEGKQNSMSEEKEKKLLVTNFVFRMRFPKQTK